MTMRTKKLSSGSTAPTRQSGGVHEIYEQESYRKYRLIETDGTSMEQTAEQLFEGSRLLKNKSLWSANFRATIARVRNFCDSNRPEIHMALVDVRSNKVVFYFVPKSERYNLHLGGVMTELEVELGGNFGIGLVETLQVPERSMDRFIGESSLLVWDSKSST